MKRHHLTTLGVLILVGVLTGALHATPPLASVRVTLENLAPDGGVHLTPIWVGLHDGSFDLFDPGSLASEPLERLAEDGDLGPLRAAFAAGTMDAGGMDTVVTAPEGFPGAPIFEPGERRSVTLSLSPMQHRYLSFAGMVIPSNDAFVGNHDPRAIELFDAAGASRGKRIITVLGREVWDAGTELNTEMDAAFINQTAADTGMATACPVLPHPGFLGAAGNPGGEPIILGGMTAAGTVLDAVAGDFSLRSSVVLRITVEPVSP